MKYIMLQIELDGLKMNLPIIFPKVLVHKDMVFRIQHLLGAEHRWDSEVVSAGFINMFTLECHGRSESLDIDSRKEDTEIIKRYECEHGLVE